MLKNLLVAAVFLGGAAGSQAQNAAFTPLFNGKDLSGWKQLGGKAQYVVESGTITGITVAKTPNSFLVTEKEYGDFILELDMWMDSAANSGIQVRSLSKPDYLDGRVHGYQVEVDPSERGWSGGVYDESRRGWLYPMELNPSSKKLFKLGAWNHYRIEFVGNTLRTFLNGKPAAYVIDDANSKGFIALQVHSIGNEKEAGRKIRWKNVRIQTKNVKPTAYDGKMKVVNMLPNNLSAEEKKSGYSLLWDGVSTKGWKGAYKNTFPEKGWKIENGELVVLSSNGGESTNGGDIVTEKMFSAFVLEFDFKLSKGANSGVKYFVTESENNAGSAIGLEFQVLDDAVHPDAKMGAAGNRTIASLYDLIPSYKHPNAIKPVGEWNKGMIVVYPDNRVEHWLNGVRVLHYERGSQYFIGLVARSKYAQWKNFGMAKEGRILLQDHGDEVHFRSIKIKTL
ncbi:MAG: 3-keto-disaccharide hydrolase [Chitinophagaceae bacterium]